MLNTVPTQDLRDSPMFSLLTLVSHELRTPLTTILGYADLIHAEEVQDPREIKKYMEAICRSAHSQAQVIDHLLDASGILNNHLQLDLKSLDIIPVASRVLSRLSSEIEKKHLTVEFKINTASAWVLADEARLEQIFENIFSNAAKFSHHWGEIKIQIDRKEFFIEVSVQDKGIGIAPENLEKVFGLFAQLDSSLTRRYGGLGLGLAITRYVVQAHGGQIHAESEGLGKGTLFRFRLPLHQS